MDGSTNLESQTPINLTPIAWGAKVSPAFRDKVRDISQRLGIDPSHLMACMAFESGHTFSPNKQNAAGSGACGLIQFMPQTAQALGTTTKALAAMTPVQQLDYVYLYFKPLTNKLHTLSDLYMAILWPRAVGKPDDYVLFDRNDPRSPKLYIQNAGLDYNKDGKITKAEAASKVALALKMGSVYAA